MVSQQTRHKVCHHPVTMAPNLAETRRRQGAPCHRGKEKQQRGRIPMLLEVMAWRSRDKPPITERQ
ncbi:hypothetical protein GBF38_004347 [Scomber scombrus]